MKASAIAILLLGTAATRHMSEFAQLQSMTNDEALHFFEFDNAKMLWKNDWEAYRDARESTEHDCRLAETDNWHGAQQCEYQWGMPWCQNLRTWWLVQWI